jgi:chromosomal replication initiation ATPase DnaA
MHVHDILKTVSKFYGVEPEIVLSSNRSQITCKVRDVWTYILYNEGRSTTDVSKITKRERSSVSHSLIRTRRALKEDDSFRQDVLFLINITRQQRMQV